VKRAWADAARAEEVRQAAEGWENARAIDAGTEAAVEAAHPLDRVALHPAWRVLAFILAVVAVFALEFAIFRSSSTFWPMAISAIVLAAVTEWLRGSRFSGTGADAATSFLALCFFVMALGILVEKRFDSDAEVTLLLAATCAGSALAAWRWGFWFFAAVAAGSAFLFAGRFPGVRPSWIVVSTLTMAFCFRRLDRASTPPPHRRSFAAVFAVSAAALYAAIHLFLLDRRFLETLRGTWGSARGPVPPAPAALRFLFAAATAVFPLVFLVWGIRSRRRLILGIGLVSAILSVATFRHYVPIGPRWAWLTACGAVLIAAALWIHRRLRDAAGGAWRGLTAAPLYSVETEGGISPLAALGAHVAVPTAPEPERPGYTGGGGGFGGGGASGQY
jgi:hypothetical protein